MRIYVLEPRVLSYIPRNQFLELPDPVLRMIQRGERVMGYPFEGYWQHLGRTEDYEQAVREIETLRPQILEAA